VIRVALSNEIWVRRQDSVAIEEAAERRRAQSPCGPSGSKLADALAAMTIAPLCSDSARFPFVECRHVEETTDVRWVTSGGAERRPRTPPPEERIVHLEWVVAIRPEDEPRVREYAATREPVPISIESAVDDLVVYEYPSDWWDGCEFEIRDYSFSIVK
jgi:hypothetical protein